ncbi:MAG: redox-sensing transcriptional repressor Rex [Verrucomicrobiales bacterium]|nr:redox-sensing transcriptional repressor Rex [Verrucomicrobiales bacterium]
MDKVEIPRKTVYRLSVYQRCLLVLAENEVETVSSDALAKAAGVKSPQLRKDLGFVGQFGTRGLGYNVNVLSEAITVAMGMTSLQPVILVGVGNLGAALLRYSGFHREGFEIVAAFDLYPENVRLKEDSKVVLMGMDEMRDFVREKHVKMAIMAVPASSAQSVTNDLVEEGVQAILNFSPTVLQVPEKVVVNNVDLALELESLSYFVR